MSAAAIQFTPLCGARDDAALCYLLQIGDYKILLDCGWDDSFDIDSLKPIKPIAAGVDAVLLTYPDIPHLGTKMIQVKFSAPIASELGYLSSKSPGALPYAYGKLGLHAPIFGTIPVYEMGQMALYDAYLSKQMSEDCTIFDLVCKLVQVRDSRTSFMYSDRSNVLLNCFLLLLT